MPARFNALCVCVACVYARKYATFPLRVPRASRARMCEKNSPSLIQAKNKQTDTLTRVGMRYASVCAVKRPRGVP